jgi:hypothetical protein
MSKTADEVIGADGVAALAAAGFVIVPKKLIVRAADEICNLAGLVEGDRYFGNEVEDELNRAIGRG